ncbi:MAG: pilus assembly protein PilM [Phycisphaerales bacterium]|nr:pilus assembly protein PilM [Phycisphaerales bacterium]
MIRLTRSHIQPIGIDFGTDSIKLIQLEVTGQSLAVVAAARRQISPGPWDDPQRVAQIGVLLRQMLRQGGFSGRRIVTALPREMVHVKNIRLPNMPPQELAQAVNFEAAHLFPFEVHDSMVHHIIAGEVRQATDVKQEVIVLAVQPEQVNRYLEQLHNWGLVVESLDIEPAALYRTTERFIRRKEDENGVHALVDVGLQRSQVIIGRGREINFIKTIDLGATHLDESVSRQLGISLAEAGALRRRLGEAADSEDELRRDPVRQAVFDATRSVMMSLAREVSLCLRYYSVTFRGYRPTKIKVMGGQACDNQVLAQLAGNLPIPVEPGRPLLNVNISRMKASDRRGVMSEWSLALGLGMRLVAGPFAPRDGAPRDPYAQRTDLTSAAQVVDLDQATGAVANEQGDEAILDPAAVSQINAATDHANRAPTSSHSSVMEAAHA